MPADSEVSLPHTWRPLGVRLAGIFFGALLLIVCVVAWLGFDPEVRAKFTIFQRGTVIFFGLLAFTLGLALTRSRVVASHAGLHVVNGFKARDFEWAEVVAIRLPPGAPWATLDLTDGTTASVMALQGSDGDRAQDAVRSIRGLIDTA